MKTMKQMIVTGPRKTEIIEVPVPEINDSQILVKITLTGMCHSEFYPWHTRAARVIGHEWVGVVEKTGLNNEYGLYVKLKHEDAVSIYGNLDTTNVVEKERILCRDHEALLALPAVREFQRAEKAYCNVVRRIQDGFAQQVDIDISFLEE